MHLLKNISLFDLSINLYSSKTTFAKYPNLDEIKDLFDSVNRGEFPFVRYNYDGSGVTCKGVAQLQFVQYHSMPDPLGTDEDAPSNVEDIVFYALIRPFNATTGAILSATTRRIVLRHFIDGISGDTYQYAVMTS